MSSVNIPKKIIGHHANGTLLNPQASTQHHTIDIIDATHKSRWNGFTSKVFKNSRGEFYHVGYHFVIEKDGTWYQTRELNEEGAHTIGMNRSSIGVLFIGNFDTGVDSPTGAQQRAFIKIFNLIKDRYPHITAYDIDPHRKYAAKSCFGSSLPDDYLTRIILDEGTYSQDTEKEQYEAQRILLLTTWRELLEQYVAMLIQVASGRRLSLKEK